MRSVKAPFPLQVTYEFEDADGGSTLARIRTGGETGRYYAFAGPLLGAMVKRGVARDLRALEAPHRIAPSRPLTTRARTNAGPGRRSSCGRSVS